MQAYFVLFTSKKGNFAKHCLNWLNNSRYHHLNIMHSTHSQYGCVVPYQKRTWQNLQFNITVWLIMTTGVLNHVSYDQAANGESSHKFRKLSQTEQGVLTGFEATTENSGPSKSHASALTYVYGLILCIWENTACAIQEVTNERWIDICTNSEGTPVDIAWGIMS